MADRITDIGPPRFDKFLPPVIKDNYGKWKYHEILEPGVLVHLLRVRRQGLFRPGRLRPPGDHRLHQRSV